MDPNFPNFSIDPFSICRSLSLPSHYPSSPPFFNSLQTQFESFLRNRSKSGLVLNFFRSNFSHINLSFCHQPPAAPSVINPRLGSILRPSSSQPTAPATLQSEKDFCLVSQFSILPSERWLLRRSPPKPHRSTFRFHLIRYDFPGAILPPHRVL